MHCFILQMIHFHYYAIKIELKTMQWKKLKNYNVIEDN